MEDIKEDKLKQILVVRHDLNMRKGKIASQCSHASGIIILNHLQELYKLQFGEENYYPGNNAHKLHEWCYNGKFTKVCVYVNSEQELLDIYNKAKESNILCSLVTDSGLTEFHGVPTNTCCAIGPDYSSIIDPITGNLKLM